RGPRLPVLLLRRAVTQAHGLWPGDAFHQGDPGQPLQLFAQGQAGQPGRREEVGRCPAAGLRAHRARPDADLGGLLACRCLVGILRAVGAAPGDPGVVLRRFPAIRRACRADARQCVELTADLHEIESLRAILLLALWHELPRRTSSVSLCALFPPARTLGIGAPLCGGRKDPLAKLVHVVTGPIRSRAQDRIGIATTRMETTTSKRAIETVRLNCYLCGSADT